MTEYNHESRAKVAEVYGPEKTRDQKREGGLITDWRLVPLGGQEDKLVIKGITSGDDYWADGKPLRTSLIVSINEDETEAETLNTIYKLGTKASA